MTKNDLRMRSVGLRRLMTHKTKRGPRMRPRAFCTTVFPEVATLAEAAPLLGVSVTTLWRWIGRHKLGRRSGATWLLTRVELEQLAASPRPRPGCPLFVPGNQLWRRARRRRKKFSS